MKMTASSAPQSPISKKNQMTQKNRSQITMKKSPTSLKTAANSSASRASRGESFSRRRNARIERSSKESSRRSVSEKR